MMCLSIIWENLERGKEKGEGVSDAISAHPLYIGSTNIGKFKRQALSLCLFSGCFRFRD